MTFISDNARILTSETLRNQPRRRQLLMKFDSYSTLLSFHHSNRLLTPPPTRCPPPQNHRSLRNIQSTLAPPVASANFSLLPMPAHEHPVLRPVDGTQ